MRLAVSDYRDFLSRQINNNGWIRCLIWGLIKTALEGVVFFLQVDHLLMRISLGLIWVGIVAGGMILLLASLRMTRLVKLSKRLKFFFFLEIAGLAALIAQLPLLAWGLFFADGLVTIASTFLISISGYRVGMELKRADPDNFSNYER